MKARDKSIWNMKILNRFCSRKHFFPLFLCLNDWNGKCISVLKSNEKCIYRKTYERNDSWIKWMSNDWPKNSSRPLRRLRMPFLSCSYSYSHLCRCNSNLMNSKLLFTQILWIVKTEIIHEKEVTVCLSEQMATYRARPSGPKCRSLWVRADDWGRRPCTRTSPGHSHWLWSGWATPGRIVQLGPRSPRRCGADSRRTRCI